MGWAEESQLVCCSVQEWWKNWRIEMRAQTSLGHCLNFSRACTQELPAAG